MIVGWPGTIVRRVTTRRTRCTLRARATWRCGRAARCTTRDRVFATAQQLLADARTGVDDTCTAPPPISAPPQVQAHSFARAIRTDIDTTLVPGAASPDQLYVRPMGCQTVRLPVRGLSGRWDHPGMADMLAKARWMQRL